MRAAWIAGKIHKWLALLMAVQILFWFVSGLFFAIAPIETVRSEHRIAEQAAAAIPLAQAAEGLRRIGLGDASAAERIEIRSMLGRPVALVSEKEARLALYDLSTGQRLSPIGAATAAEIAEADHDGEERAARVARLMESSTEYRGPLPAWRVDFEDGANRAIYVGADTGAVTARRSTLWRVFDFLWSLHIMDFKEHEDFNTPLLIGATALGLIVIVTGIVMFPSRLGLNAWRRRRSAQKGARKKTAAP